MAQINNIACTFIRGTLCAQRERLEIWEVPGINGYGVAQLGLADSVIELRAVLFSDNAGLNLWSASLQALQGTIAAVTNDHDDSYAYCLLVKVGNIRKTPAVIPGSGVTLKGEIEIQAILL